MGLTEKASGLTSLSGESAAVKGLTSPLGAKLNDDDRRKLLFDIKGIAESLHPGGLRALEEAAEKSGFARQALEAKHEECHQETKRLFARSWELTKEARELADRLQVHSETVFARTLRFLRLPDSAQKKLSQEIGARRDEAASVDARISRIYRDPLPPASSVPTRDEHLHESLEKLRTSKLSPEETRGALDPAFVCGLSMDDFIAMWRRLDPAFLSHVTRHGVRDHCAMVYHSAGLGQYHDSLREILQDGNVLRPPIAARHGLLDLSPESVRAFLGPYVLLARDLDDAHSRLNSLLYESLASAPAYPDKAAMHFAADTVADEFYGAETGNCPFFVVPSAVIAANYPFAFNGWEKTFARQSETKWNDVFVWSAAGMRMDLGILFLPKSVLVDPDTGSRYKLSPAGSKPRTVVTDEGLLRSFVQWGATLGGDTQVIAALQSVFVTRGEGHVSAERISNAQAVVRQALSGLGISADDQGPLSRAIVRLSQQCRLWEQEGQALDRGSVERLARGFSLRFVRAEHTVTAESFWRKHFELHPKLEPKRVVFYDGEPTQAVLRFQADNHLDDSLRVDRDGQMGWPAADWGSRNPSEPLLGFPDNYVADMSQDQRALAGLEELEQTARKFIDKWYGSQR